MAEMLRSSGNSLDFDRDGENGGEPIRASFEDDGYEEDWSNARKTVSKILASKYVECTLCVIVAFSVVLLTMQTDCEAASQVMPTWMATANFCLIAVYTLELVLRLYAWRQFFFKSGLQWLDLAVVCVDLFLEGTVLLSEGHDLPLPSVMVLRVFRILRIFRSSRAVTLFPELGVMFLGLFGALKAMFWGIVLLALVILCASIVAVQLIHPVARELASEGYFAGCERCGRAFESVGAAALTSVQLNIVGDDWSTLALPMIERYPITALFFATNLITIGMTVLNLILAVVVDSGNQARIATDRLVADAKRLEYRRMHKKLLKQCAEMDISGTGTLTLKELKHGFRCNAGFRDLMGSLGVDEAELVKVFNMIDAYDRDGHITYTELIYFLHKMVTEDQRTMTCLIRFCVTEMHREMRQGFRSELRSIEAVVSALQDHARSTPEAATSLGNDVCGILNVPARNVETQGSRPQESNGNDMQLKAPDPQAHQHGQRIEKCLQQLQQDMRTVLEELERLRESRTDMLPDGSAYNLECGGWSAQELVCGPPAKLACILDPPLRSYSIQTNYSYQKNTCDEMPTTSNVVTDR